jgi:hypothetical protein
VIESAPNERKRLARSGHCARHSPRRLAEGHVQGFTAWRFKKRRRKSVEEAGSEDDWQFLWDSLPESAKEQVQKFVDDERLLLHAKELNLWKFLWYAAPEEAKERLRYQWEQAPKISRRSD